MVDVVTASVLARAIAFDRTMKVGTKSQVRPGAAIRVSGDDIEAEL